MVQFRLKISNLSTIAFALSVRVVVVYPMKISQLQCETPACANYQSLFWSKMYQQERIMAGCDLHGLTSFYVLVFDCYAV